MKMNELNKVATKKVSDLLEKGFWLNAETMRGTQGELLKVDLTDGKEVIRISIVGTYVGPGNNGVSVREEGFDVEDIEVMGTLWNGKGNYTETSYYKNTNNKHYWEEDAEYEFVERTFVEV